MLEMIIWGFFAAFGSMGANYLVEKYSEPRNNKAAERDERSIPEAIQRSDKAECKRPESPVQEVAR